MRVLRTEARQPIQAEFGASRFWGFKDPRTIRLLPFWQGVLADLGCDVRYVLVLRHPLSVARSLERRDGLSLEEGVRLWVLHLLPGLIQTAGQPRVVIDYDRLLVRPRPELNRLAKRLRLPLPTISELEAYERHFLDPSLRHSVYDVSSLKGIPGPGNIALELYQLLRRAATDELDLERPEVRARIRGLGESFHGGKPPLVLRKKVLPRRTAPWGW